MLTAEEDLLLTRTGPDTLGGKYLRLFWQPVYRSQDLKPGRAVPLHILNERFTLYRGETGAVHIVGDRCAHRGTQLSTGWVEGDSVRCLYHGWKYDVAEVWPCNYFNRMDNDSDPQHTVFTHHESQVRANPAARPTIVHVEAEETDYGMKTTGVSSNGSSMSVFVHMPNVLQIRPRGRTAGDISDSSKVGAGLLIVDRLTWRVPIDDEHCVAYGLEQTFWVEDYASQVGQGAFADRTSEHLGKMDTAIILRRKIFLRELHALAEGRPLKQWQMAEGLADTALR
jgi:hypothetical protein